MFSYFFSKRTPASKEHSVVDVDNMHDGASAVYTPSLEKGQLRKDTQVITFKHSTDEDFTTVDFRPLSYSEVIRLSLPDSAPNKVVIDPSTIDEDQEDEYHYSEEDAEEDLEGSHYSMSSSINSCSDFVPNMSNNVRSEFEYGDRARSVARKTQDRSYQYHARQVYHGHSKSRKGKTLAIVM